MSSFTSDIIEQIKRLAERIRNLELSVYVYGRQPDAPPANLTVGSVVGVPSYYVEPVSQLPRASVQWTWQAPNADQEDPIGSYWVSITRSTDATTGAFYNVGNVTSLVTSDHPVDTNVTFRIYAVTEKGVVGPTTTVTRVVAKSTEQLPQPSTPTVVSGIKSVVVTNDGKTNVGANMPAGFSHYEIHILHNGAATFTPTNATFFARAGLNDSVVVPANDFYHNIAVRLVAVNTSGVASTPSTGVVGTPKKVIADDTDITLPEGAIYSDDGNLVVDGSFESANIRTLRTGASFIGSGIAYSNLSGGAQHGSWFVRATGSQIGATDSAYYLTAAAYDNTNILSALQVIGGGKYYYSLQVRNIGANGNLSVVFEWTLQDGSKVLDTENYTPAQMSSGDWAQIQGVYSAPDNAISLRPYVLIRKENSAGEWRIDAFEIRRVLGTTLIEDGAITRAKIGTAAIGSAEIEEVDAALIKSGIIDANRIGAGTIQTRHFVAGAVDKAALSSGIGSELDIQANPALSDMASATQLNGLSSTVQDVVNDITSLNNVVVIDSAGVTITDNASPFSVNMNNAGLNLMEGSARVAYINGQRMYIRSAEIAEQLKIGVHIIEKYDTNNTFIRWVG